MASVAARLWEQSGREPVDGVLQFDPASLAPLLDWTGPVAVDRVPRPLTSANLEPFLLFDQYVQFPLEQAPRREVLDTVAQVTFERLVTADLPGPRTLINRFRGLVRGGHLHIVSFDRAAGRFLDRVDLDGRFEAPASDGLMVANVNSTGNKIDTFLAKSVAYDATVDGDGNLTGRVVVSLTNAAPSARLPGYVIGSATNPPLPPGTNRTNLFVYTATKGGRVLLDGVPARSSRVLYTQGWWLHEVTVELPPGATRVVEVEVAGRLPSEGGPYRLELEPGGGSVPDTYRVNVHTDRDEITYSGRVITGVVLR